MSATDPTQEATRRWLAYARADLREAQLNIAHDGVPYIACFHAQQAAEKAIKACYVWQREPFSRLHDLDRLRNLLLGDWAFKTDFPDLSALTVWAVQGRYPDAFIDATPDEAAEALSTAEALLTSIVNDLVAAGYDDSADGS